MFLVQGAGGAMMGVTVLMMDLGFQERELMVVVLVSSLPLALKCLVAGLSDRAQPPWRGGLMWPYGRRRPVIMYAMILLAVFTVAFGLANGSEPSPVPVCLMGALMRLMGVYVQVGIDGHAMELMAAEPPEYVPESLSSFRGRIAGERAMAQSLGETLCTIWVTQVGPAWSWEGAYAVLGGLMLPCALAALLLDDAVDSTPRGAEKLGLRVVCDWCQGRGEHRDVYRALRGVYFCYFLGGFSLGGAALLTIPFLKRQFDITPQIHGYVQLAAALGTMCGACLGGLLADNHGSRRVLKGGCCASLGLPILLLQAGKHSLELSFAVVTFSGLLVGPLVASVHAMTYAMMAPSAPATTFSMAMTAANCGGLLSAFLLLVSEYSYDMAFGAISVALSVLAVFSVCFFRHERALPADAAGAGQREEGGSTVDAEGAARGVHEPGAQPGSPSDTVSI